MGAGEAGPARPDVASSPDRVTLGSKNSQEPPGPPAAGPSLESVVLGQSTASQAGAPQLKFHADGTFKILQLTDIHFQPEEGPAYAAKYNAIVDTLLETEKPDMVVITGDVLYWSGRPMREYFDAALAPIIEHRTPWAFTMGNHDAESWFTGEDVMQYLRDKPFSLCQPGPKSLGASGNYPVEVHSAKDGQTEAVLYMLDTHDHHERAIDYSQDLAGQLEGTHAKPHYKLLEQKHGQDAMGAYRAIAALKRDQMAVALGQGLEIQLPSGRTIQVTREDFVPLENHGYDWLSPEQVQWYGDLSAEYARKEDGKPVPALMFFHVPLPEYPSAWSTTAVGNKLEDESVQGRNTGMFSMIREKNDVVGVFAGHDHLNDYVGSLDGVALAYGRKTGLSVYGPDPMERGGRVIVLHEDERGFDTWIRTASGKVESPAVVPDDLRARP